jgi:hypothetical protein
MAGIWADFPSGSRGLYGDNENAMLDGIWASASDCPLVADPDPAIGSAGRVLSIGPASTNANCVLSLPAAHATVIFGRRIWVNALPSNAAGPHIFRWLATDGSTIAILRLLPTGAIVLTSDAGSTIGETSGPVMTANGWWHIEAKLTCSTVGAGAFELRVNGVTKMTLAGLTTSHATTGKLMMSRGDFGSTLGGHSYCKDLTINDGSGAQNSDFLGTVTVFWRKVVSDLSLGGWIPNVGATGTPLIDDDLPSNTLTSTGAIANGEQVRIDNTYYQWTSGSVDAGAPAGTAGNPWLVALGGDDATSLENLYKAIGATGTAGTTYSTALTAHTTVTPLGYTATKVTVVPTDGTTTAMTFTETGANISWALPNSLEYGPTDASFISADDSPPAASEFELEDLPPDITSIRYIVPAVRAAKVDGGDGNLQLALSSNGVDYDDGPDTPITTAFTYWGNATAPFVSELDPDTGAAWTPGAYNAGGRLRIDRTL